MSVDDLTGAKLGNYRLERLLGRGRMGVVYLARDEALLRPTAVKLLSWSLPALDGLEPDAWFLAEARHIARISHPHVVRIYAVARHREHCYIAMEYVDGVAAEDWLAEHGAFSPLRATEILLQTAGALQAAHDADVVHRDVKPGNLLIAGDGAAKLGDFGLAIPLDGERGAAATPRAGTPLYTAPEIWRGAAATPASDIYALGATYYHLLTGRPPFIAGNVDELAAAHVRGEVPDPQRLVQGLPGTCGELIRRCLAKAPHERYPSAQALSWEARGALRELSGAVAPAVRSRAVLDAAETRRPDGAASRPSDGAGAAEAPASGTALGASEPFRSVAGALRASLEDPSLHAVLFSGARGSGKTTLVHDLMAERSGAGPVAFVARDEPGESLHQQAARAFGIVPALSSRSNSEIDELLDGLERLRLGASDPAWLVVDGLTPSSAELAELLVLERAAATSRCFRLLVIASPELDELWSQAAGARALGVGRVRMPELTLRQSVEYLAGLELAEESAQRLLVTPDAALLIAHRSDGNLARINRLVSGLRQGAAREGRLLVSSWDVWTAEAGDPPRGAAPAGPKPRDWPSGDALAVLNALRRAAGLTARR